MTTDDAPGELTTIDGVPTLRFERRFAHPPQRVWHAISDPAELSAWFPAAVEVELRAGAPMRFTFGDRPDGTGPWDGEVLDVDPPKVLMFRWNHDVLRFEVIAEEPGCRLVFTHALGHGATGRLGAARTAAGWDGCLAALAAAIDDGETTSASDGWLARAEAYTEKFGLGRGYAEAATGAEVVVRFTRDLVPQTVDDAWGVLVEDTLPQVGATPPVRAVNPAIGAGSVLAVQTARLLEYELTLDEQTAGWARWEFVADPDTGARLEFTHTLPGSLHAHRARLLAVWQVHLELFYAACRGEIRCPWPAQRVVDLTATYIEA